jgi:hypothetical protein
VNNEIELTARASMSLRFSVTSFFSPPALATESSAPRSLPK